MYSLLWIFKRKGKEKSKKHNYKMGITTNIKNLDFALAPNDKDLFLELTNRYRAQYVIPAEAEVISI